jgi:hypothetical protein
MVGMQAVAKQDRTKEPRSGLVIAATRLSPAVGGKHWTFYVINTTPKPIESILLEEVSYEWGDEGSSKTVNARFGALAPAAYVEIWREEDVELRTSVHLKVHDATGAHLLMAELPALSSYMWRKPVVIPILARKGYIATELYWKTL